MIGKKYLYCSRKMLLFRRLACCDGLGRWCDGSAVGGNVIRHWCQRLLVWQLFLAAEVGLCEFSSTYSSIDSLTNRGGLWDLSPCAATAETLVMSTLCCYAYSACFLFPQQTRVTWKVLCRLTGGQQKCGRCCEWDWLWPPLLEERGLLKLNKEPCFFFIYCQSQQMSFLNGSPVL